MTTSSVGIGLKKVYIIRSLSLVGKGRKSLVFSFSAKKEAVFCGHVERAVSGLFLIVSVRRGSGGLKSL